MILAIETATDVCGTALVHQQRVVAHRTVVDRNIHSEKLLPMIDEVLRLASVSLDHVEAIAVSIGPGSFTGLRIGLTTAKGLAVALSRPLVAVPTLDALVQEYLRSGAVPDAKTVCALIDAKRDEAFFAIYSVDAAGFQKRSGYQIASASTIVDAVPSDGLVVFVGDAIRKIRNIPALNKQLSFVDSIRCNPVSVGLLAEGGIRLSASETSVLEPMYLRDFTATQSGARHAGSSQPSRILPESIGHSLEG